MALSEKGKIKVQELIDKLGTRKTGVKLIDVHLGKLGISSSDLTDSTTFMYGLDAIDELLEGGDLDGAFESAKETAREMLEDEGFPGMYESVKPKKMKIVKYKKEFKSIDEALKKIPDILKENNKVFKITDGNKTIKVRWEGTLLEGNAVALMATDEKLIKEDVNNMKRLMGYKSENTLGNHNSKGRVMENDKFKELLSVTKKKR